MHICFKIKDIRKQYCTSGSRSNLDKDIDVGLAAKGDSWVRVLKSLKHQLVLSLSMNTYHHYQGEDSIILS